MLASAAEDWVGSCTMGMSAWNSAACCHLYWFTSKVVTRISLVQWFTRYTSFPPGGSCTRSSMKVRVSASHLEECYIIG